MLKFGGDDTKIGNISVRGNIGVRWVTTDVSSTRWRAVPAAAPRPDLPVRTGRRRSACAHACGRPRVHELADATPQSGGANHTNWLPSLNVRFGLTDDQFMRFAASRALARAGHGSVQVLLHGRGVDAGQLRVAAPSRTTVPGDCSSNAGCLHAAVHRGHRQSGAQADHGRSARPHVRVVLLEHRLVHRGACSTRSSTTTSVKRSFDENSPTTA